MALGGESTADTPQLEDALKALTPIFPETCVILNGLRNKGPATWLHKFTHGGGCSSIGAQMLGWRTS